MKKTKKPLSLNTSSFSFASYQQAASITHISFIKKFRNAVTDFIVSLSIGNLNSLFSPFRFFKTDESTLIHN